MRGGGVSPGYGRSVRRLCSRPGCSTLATTVFGFDPGASTVWLGALVPDGPREAGDLCDRHAAAMTAPHGWDLEDRRGTVAVATDEPPARRRKVTAARSGAHSAGTAGTKARKRRARAQRDSATEPLPFDGSDDVEGSKWDHVVAETIPGEAVGSRRSEVGGATSGAGGATAAAVGATAGAEVAAAATESGARAGARASGVAEASVAGDGWTPRFDRDDDLDGLLDAKTPLLGRAFRNIRSV